MPDEPTTPDLEELARRSLEATVRGDFDTASAFYRADAVWDASPLGVGPFGGREAIRGFWEEWVGTYEDWSQELENFTDLGNDVTIAVIHQRARLTGSSGGFVELHYAAVGTWTDGLIERITIYTDIDEARAAAERLAEERG